MNIDHRRLPFGTQDFLKYLGDELAFKLMEAKGGRYINVPTQYIDGKDYAVLGFLTDDELKLLIKCYAGENLLVPKYDKIAKQVRDGRIRTLRAEGKTINELAEMFKLTERQIYTICDEVFVEDQNQEPDLFGERPAIKRQTQYRLRPVRLGLDDLSEIAHGLEAKIMQHDHFAQNEPDEVIKESHKQHIKKAEAALDKVNNAKKLMLTKVSTDT